jgi:ParB/RepB/Spo0J family partition protein
MDNIVFELNPIEVKIPKDLPRYRKDSPKIRELLASILRLGQFVPIIVTRDHTLIAGGRRLAACILGGIPVKCIYRDTASPLQIREIELEENIQREAYTPADEADAIADLHRIKQELYGEAQSGRKGGWRLDDTADSIGKTRGTVIENLHISETLKLFPELRELKTKKAIKSAARAAEMVVQRASSVEDWKKKVDKAGSLFLENADAREHMLKQKDNSIDILLTDPKYGMNIDKTARGIAGVTGGISIAGYKFEDSTEESLELIALLASESYRFCTNKAHAYIFVCPEHFVTVREMFISNGWQAYIKPLIWIKREIGQTNLPERWPSSCYEMILYCRRTDSRIIMQGMPDWIQCNPILPGKRIHPTEKPTDVLINLIRRVAVPGQVLYDPFCGSGSSLEAGLRQQLICKGCDIDINAYNAAMERIGKLDLSPRGNLFDAEDRAEARPHF